MKGRYIVLIGIFLIALISFLIFDFQGKESTGLGTPMRGVLFEVNGGSEKTIYFVTHSIKCPGNKLCDFSSSLDKVLTSQQVKEITNVESMIPQVPKDIISREDAKEVVKERINFEKDITLQKKENYTIEDCISQCKDRNEKSAQCDSEENSICPKPIPNCLGYCKGKLRGIKQRSSFWNQNFSIGSSVRKFVSNDGGIKVHNVSGYVVPVYNRNESLAMLIGVDAYDGKWSSSGRVGESEIKYDEYKESKFNQAGGTLSSYLKSKGIKGSIQESYYVNFKRENFELANELLKK